jgi:uncharacterized membrane protein
MKDIVVTAKRIKKELYILLGCFALACILNVISIILFQTEWLEVFTQIGYVLIITFSIYLLIIFIRLVIWLFLTLFSSRKSM